MTESEYVKVTNLSKVRSMFEVGHEILCGDEYGIDKEKFTLLLRELNGIMGDLEKSFEIEPEGGK